MLLGTLLLCTATIETGGGPPTIRYRGGNEGPVVFNHQVHASKGIRCNDCHTNYKESGKQLFATRKQGLICFDDHGTETKCFACHNDSNESNDSNVSNDCNYCHY